MKRPFDVCCAALGLGILWPLLLVVAILIKLDSRGPIFFRQERMGRWGKPFRIWKFRTMVPDAPRKGRGITVGRDPRITRVGYWLRKWKIDELPQLLNVLRGEMSLVGPRPEVSQYVSLYSPAQRAVLNFKPGITDPASLRYRNEGELLASAADPERLYIQQILPHKIELNLAYANEATFWSDLKVILRTLLPIGAAPRRWETS